MAILDAKVSKPFEGGPSFSLKNRVTRLVWNIVWFILASWTPRFLDPWRRTLLRLFGAKVASTANIYGSARIWLPANLEIGAHSCIGPRVNVYSMANITVGDYAIVSQGAHLCTGTHDIDDPHFQLRTRPISIGSHVWIAAEAFVGPGVTIGEGAVLAARGCAFRDLEPWTVYLGNPAHALKIRRKSVR